MAFEREVFTYPQFSRRNPFKTLVSAEGGGPRFENLLLLGILYSPFAGESIAVFGEGTRTTNPAGAAGRGTVTVELTGGTYRVREGTTLGNLSMNDIRFPRPVHHGDTLRAQTTILAKRESRSKPDRGVVTFAHRAFNQRGEEVAYCERVGMMLKRPAA